jgi:tetratricopeptide (TPR) repeat protein
VIAIGVLAAVSLVAVTLPWLTIGLSLRNLSVLQSSERYATRGTWPRLSEDAKERLCLPVDEISLAEPTLLAHNKSRYRLSRYLVLSCRAAEVQSDWIKSALAKGLTPDEADIVYFSQALEANGEWEQALALRRLNPNSAVWYANQGWLSGQVDQNSTAATRYFRLAQAIDPKLDARKSLMYLYLCMAYVRDGETRELSQPCNNLHTVEQSPTSEILLGQALLRDGNPALALDHLLKAIELDPSRPEAYYWSAKALMNLEDKAPAKRALRVGNRLAPTYGPIGLDLAHLEVLDGCYESASKVLSNLDASELPEIAREIAAMRDDISGRRNMSDNCD